MNSYLTHWVTRVLVVVVVFDSTRTDDEKNTTRLDFTSVDSAENCQPGTEVADSRWRRSNASATEISHIANPTRRDLQILPVSGLPGFGVVSCRAATADTDDDFRAVRMMWTSLVQRMIIAPRLHGEDGQNGVEIVPCFLSLSSLRSYNASRQRLLAKTSLR